MSSETLRSQRSLNVLWLISRHPSLAIWAEGEQPTLSLAPLVDLLERGEFDLVAAGRAVLADPHWAAKASDGRLPEIRPYDKSLDAHLY